MTLHKEKFQPNKVQYGRSRSAAAILYTSVGIESAMMTMALSIQGAQDMGIC